MRIRAVAAVADLRSPALLLPPLSCRTLQIPHDFRHLFLISRPASDPFPEPSSALPHLKLFHPVNLYFAIFFCHLPSFRGPLRTSGIRVVANCHQGFVNGDFRAVITYFGTMVPHKGLIFGAAFFCVPLVAEAVPEKVILYDL